MILDIYIMITQSLFAVIQNRPVLEDPSFEIRRFCKKKVCFQLFSKGVKGFLILK